jgi:hypothetical protein
MFKNWSRESRWNWDVEGVSDWRAYFNGMSRFNSFSQKLMYMHMLFYFKKYIFLFL